MLKHKLLLDKARYAKKPEKKEIGTISKQIINNAVELAMEELSYYVTQPNGQTWIPGYIEGARTADNWKSQSVFALDFDGGITFEKVKLRLEEYGLDCCFAYNTFSSTSELPKFRVIWQLNQTVTDIDYRSNIQLALMYLFPESDKSCTDANRMYFGGIDIIYKNYDYYLDIDILLESGEFYAVRNSSSKNMKRNIKKIDELLKINQNGSKKRTLYNINIGTVENASQIQSIRGVDFEQLRKEMQILDDFMNPNIKLKHPILLGLATNLRYIEGGQELYKKCIQANSQYAQQEKFNIMTYCKTVNYYPKNLETFSPYEEDWEYRNLLEAAKKKQLVRKQKYHTISIEQARQELQSILENIMKSNDTDVHIVKVPTGAGKTESSTNFENVVIGLPNHSLKDEVANRIKTEYQVTPSFDGLPKDIIEKLNYYYSIGAIGEANRFLDDQSKVDQQVKDYLDACSVCYASTNTVITTHQKALFIEWKHDTIIFDEDILTSLLPIDTVKISDLLNLEANLKNENDKKIISKLIDDIRQNDDIVPKKFNLSQFKDFTAIENEVLNGNVKYESKILYFFNSDYFLVDANDKSTIHYIIKNPLPIDKKIIILSATANETIYRFILGDRLKFHQVTNIDMTGVIQQNTKYSLSRSYFDKHIHNVTSEVGSLPVITFNQYKHLFDNAVEDMHFGKTTGFNNLKGQDIAVVGTPHANPKTIILYAVALGMPVESNAFEAIRQQCVEHNGFRFWFNAYDNDYLRNIQFHFIESELKQAVGRARVNAEPAFVKLYSNYPLPEACINDEELSESMQKLEINRSLAASNDETNNTEQI
ncbi:hypothetical protein I8748_16370 [Nostoc sp. CENA67]|uniref:Uncharacterized protein n=1 Tax=Amazonocrinis nigriterrae CENA67 TaxID=2794033 RepID=A0A8J7LA68_9NOST|nr:hypothetical protein [Amazonocrinis nigriterrae]MBH8563746.1 hypothetical protein [Amazonocrinis nigriterrae CENA67]